MNIECDVPLASLTTFEVGGPASHFCSVRSIDEVPAVVAHAREVGLPLLILGGGSNLLISDSGVRALVLKTDFLALIESRDEGLVTVSAGTSWDDVVAWAVERNLAGIECLSGIPGNTGAACVQNIGAYGQQISDVVERVGVVDLSTGEKIVLDQAFCRFGYRSSIFNTTYPDRYLITDIQIRLTPGGTATVAYSDVARAVASDAPLAHVRQTVLNIRRQKGMLRGINRSAGSFFKNPIVDGNKISAAALIEGVGLIRGFTMGRAGISNEHALALVAHESCTAQDIVVLARHIQELVNRKFGIVLEPEVQLWGFDEHPLMR